MFRVSRLLLLLAALGAVWFLWPFGKYDDTISIEPPQTHRGQNQLFTKPLSEGAGTPQDRTGATDTPQQDVAATASSQQTEPPGPPLQPKRFHRVVVQDGRSFQAGGTTITLAAIAVESPDGQCQDANGQAWPCGRFARTALTRLIRGRAVTCQVPVSGETASLTARCSVGGQDLSLWMVTHGWAKPVPPAQAALQEAEAAARERRLGIWR